MDSQLYTTVLPQAAPADDFIGPEFVTSSNSYSNRSQENEVTCTACGRQRDAYNDKLLEHPVLKVLVCETCFSFYHHGPFTKDSEEMDEQCRWCGQGGNLLMCDFCTNVFCNYCIKRNFSPEVFDRIRDEDEWACFVCRPLQIVSLVERCAKVMQEREKQTTKDALVGNDSQETFFNALREENKRLDDLIGPMESPTYQNSETRPLNIKKEPDETVLNYSEKASTEEESRKVPPVTILRAKESYVVQRRSASCDESVGLKNISHWQSDPENPTAKLKISIGRQISLQQNLAKDTLIENGMNSTNFGETVPENTDMVEKDGVSAMSSNAETADQSCQKNKNEVVGTSSAHTATVVNPPRRNVGRRTGHKVQQEVVVNPQNLVGNTEGILLQNGGEGIVEFDDASRGRKQELVTSNFQHADKVQLSVHSRMKEARGHLMSFMRIYKELMASQVSPESLNRPDSTQSPSQYSRFRTTNMLLTKVKKASSKLIRMEHDLRAQKKVLGTFKHYDDSELSFSSSEDELLLGKERKHSSGKKRLLNHSKEFVSPFLELEVKSDTCNKSAGSEPDSPKNAYDVISSKPSQLSVSSGEEAGPSSKNIPAEAKSKISHIQVSANSDQVASTVVNTPEVSNSKVLKVVLNRLSQEDVEHLSQSTGKRKDDSDVSLDTLDTDSSKNMQPDDDSDATTLQESEPDEGAINSKEKGSDIMNNIKTDCRSDVATSGGGGRPHKKVTAHSEKRQRDKSKYSQRYESDSDYEVESDDHSSSERSDFEPMEDNFLDDELSGHGDKDNEIAKRMLLQKMQQQDQDSSDSDVEKLVNNVAQGGKDKHNGQEKQKTADQSGGEGAAADDGEKGEKSAKKKLFTHPLLNQKWKDLSCDEGNDSKEGRENEEEKSTSKRKRDMRERGSEPSKNKVVTNGIVHSDSDLTTDTDVDMPIKKRRLHDNRQKKMVLGSDSDDDCMIVDGSKNTANDVNGGTHSSEIETDSEYEKFFKGPSKKVRQRLIGGFASADEANVKDQPEEEEAEETPSQKKGRKNIRKILDDDEVSYSTQLASKEEMERRKRVAAERAREDEENEDVIVIDDGPNSEMTKKVIRLSKDPTVEVHRKLIKYLKDHQVEGVQFLWDNIIEKVDVAQVKRGNGCILAHCMGLGKTLQTVTFLHTVLMSKHLPKIRTALVLCPFGTVNNWVFEFEKWLPRSSEDSAYQYKFKKLNVYELNSSKSETDRLQKLARWQCNGGVMVMGYGLFRTLLSESKRQTRRNVKDFQGHLLSPGADVIVCDEGHILKNAFTRIAAIVQSVKTQRRIILTGTPLQNNMIEYHCMVSIVKPRLLGTLKEFKNRFVNPIENGQHNDSTEGDVKLMKKRAHVLHELLSGCVQRKDYSCLRSHLAPKQEYTLKVRLSDLQIRLYEKYLSKHSIADIKVKRTSIFNDFNNLLLLLCHPRCLIMAKEKRAGKENGAEEEDDTESEEEDLSSDDSVIEVSDDDLPSSQVPKPTCLDDIYALSGWKLRNFIKDKSGIKPETRSRKKLINMAAKYLDENFCKTKEFEDSLKQKSVSELKAMIKENGGSFLGCTEKVELINIVKSVILKQTEADREWFEEFLPKQEKLSSANEHSGKIMIMLQILKGAAKLGDKVVIFSQSLTTLDLIEEVLKGEMKAMSKGLKPVSEPFAKWNIGKDYYRLDGSTPGHLRDRCISLFNDKSNVRGRLFLVSTRAGGIGINLIGANRAIVFDASWNPTHDVQSIFRLYRFGQTKTCFIYRLVAQGTMEEKIYERQVVKRSLAFRVVDEQQVERHFTSGDIAELYTFKPAPKPDSSQTVPDLPPPQDALLASIMLSNANVVSYHEPDSLLDHQVSEELSEAERRAAWEEYDLENTGKRNVVSPQLLFSSFDVPTLNNICLKGDQMLKHIQMKISEIETKSFTTVMLEIQLKDRFTSPQDAMQKALEKKLEQHIILRRLNNVKAKVIKYTTAARSVYQAKFFQSNVGNATSLPSTAASISFSSSNQHNVSAGNPPYTSGAKRNISAGNPRNFPYNNPQCKPRRTPPSFAYRQQRPYIPRRPPPPRQQYRPRQTPYYQYQAQPPPPPQRPQQRTSFRMPFAEHRRGLNNNSFRFRPTTKNL